MERNGISDWTGGISAEGDDLLRQGSAIRMERLGQNIKTLNKQIVFQFAEHLEPFKKFD